MGLSPLVPAILAAVEQDRMNDAADLADELAVERGGPLAVLQMALFADLLHQNPSTAAGQLALQVNAQINGETVASNATTGSVGLEVLEALQGVAVDGDISEAAQGIFARFDLRPGSGDVIANLCRVVRLLLSTQAAHLLLHGDATAAERFSFDNARSVLSGHGPLGLH